MKKCVIFLSKKLIPRYAAILGAMNMNIAFGMAEALAYSLSPVSFLTLTLKILSGSLKLFDSIPNPEVAMASRANFPNISLASRVSPILADSANISPIFRAD